MFMFMFMFIFIAFIFYKISMFMFRDWKQVDVVEEGGDEVHLLSYCVSHIIEYVVHFLMLMY